MQTFHHPRLFLRSKMAREGFRGTLPYAYLTPNSAGDSAGAQRTSWLRQEGCSLNVLAAAGATAKVEAAGLLVNTAGNGRAVVTDDHHNRVCPRAIKRAIPIAQHHGAV